MPVTEKDAKTGESSNGRSAHMKHTPTIGAECYETLSDEETNWTQQRIYTKMQWSSCSFYAVCSLDLKTSE